MPTKLSTSIEKQTGALMKAATGKVLLVVLDGKLISFMRMIVIHNQALTFTDMWDSQHLKSFECIDLKTSSKLLVTTRIKGVMEKAAEVELELLGLQEAVEMLAAVAQLDAADVSPVCLEIAQLCGRLPLCVNIVGNLIRTFGNGWEQEVPDILRGDMKSLAENTSGASGEQNQPLNLQQRVIQSSLDSISGSDAPKIILLFQGLAVFEEVR
jgi:hypothetical protein